MREKEAARTQLPLRRASNSHLHDDTASIARTAAYSALFLAACWAVPTAMAALKAIGWW